MDSMSAIQDYLATLDALSVGAEPPKRDKIENIGGQEEEPAPAEAVEEAAEKKDTTEEQEIDEPVGGETTAGEPDEECVEGEPKQPDEEHVEGELQPSSAGKGDGQTVIDVEKDGQTPAPNPAQAYRVEIPPEYAYLLERKRGGGSDWTAVEGDGSDTPARSAENDAETSGQTSERRCSTRYVYTASQIQDDVVRIPSIPTLKSKITDPSADDTVADMKDVEGFYNRSSSRIPKIEDKAERHLFQDRDETMTEIFDLDKDVSYDEAAKIRRLFQEVKDIDSPSAHTVFDDIPPMAGAQSVEESGSAGPAEAAPAEAAEHVSARLDGCMPLVASKFSSDADGTVGQCVLTSLDPTVVGYDVLKLLRSTMIGVLGIEIEGDVDGDECIMSYTRRDDVLTAIVEKKHGQGLLSQAAAERGEPAGLRITDVSAGSKKTVKEEMPVMPYEQAGDLMPHGLSAGFARVIFTDGDDDYMAVLSRTSPDIAVSWDRGSGRDPVLGLPTFAVKLAAELAGSSRRDFSRADVVIPKKIMQSTDRAYKYEAFEVSADGQVRHAYPEHARSMAQEGKA